MKDVRKERKNWLWNPSQEVFVMLQNVQNNICSRSLHSLPNKYQNMQKCNTLRIQLNMKTYVLQALSLKER